MISKRTTTREVQRDGNRVSVVRLRDGAPEFSFEIPDDETRDALVSVLNMRAEETATQPAPTTTVKKKTTKKTTQKQSDEPL